LEVIALYEGFAQASLSLEIHVCGDVPRQECAVRLWFRSAPNKGTSGYLFELIDSGTCSFNTDRNGLGELERSMKMAVFWVVAPCSLVEVYQRFRGP
jgi:hypothetical protein